MVDQVESGLSAVSPAPSGLADTDDSQLHPVIATARRPDDEEQSLYATRVSVQKRLDDLANQYDERIKQTLNPDTSLSKVPLSVYLSGLGTPGSFGAGAAASMKNVADYQTRQNTERQQAARDMMMQKAAALADVSKAAGLTYGTAQMLGGSGSPDGKGTPTPNSLIPMPVDPFKAAKARMGGVDSLQEANNSAQGYNQNVLGQSGDKTVSVRAYKGLPIKIPAWQEPEYRQAYSQGPAAEKNWLNDHGLSPDMTDPVVAATAGKIGANAGNQVQTYNEVMKDGQNAQDDMLTAQRLRTYVDDPKVQKMIGVLRGGSATTAIANALGGSLNWGNVGTHKEDLVSALRQYGQDDETIGKYIALQSELYNMQANARRTLPGVVQNAEQSLINQAGPSIDDSPSGIKRKIDLLDAHSTFRANRAGLLNQTTQNLPEFDPNRFDAADYFNNPEKNGPYRKLRDDFIARANDIINHNYSEPEKAQKPAEQQKTPSTTPGNGKGRKYVERWGYGGTQ